mgnify:CR=1 FL=1
MKNCLLIPTHPPHFSYALKLISSIDKFNTDTMGLDVFLVINRSSHNSLVNRISKCSFSNISLNILFLDDIICKLFKISTNPTEDLEKVFKDKFSFQSLKKILTLKYLVTIEKYDVVYVMDSEGLFIRPFSFNSIISNYLNKKRVFFNSKQRNTINGLWPQNKISKEILKTELDPPGWLLENYLWIFEKKIVIDFFNLIFKDLHKLDDLILKFPIRTFVEIVYYHFIFINNSIYNYSFIDTFKLYETYLDKDDLDLMLNEKCCLMEGTCKLITFYPHSLDKISKLYTDENIINLRVHERPEVNQFNINFLKNTKSVLCVNSGEFPLSFEINT